LQWYPEKELKEIPRLIILGRYDLLEKNILKFFENIKKLMISPDMASNLCQSILNVISSTITNMKIKLTGEAVEAMHNLMSMRYQTMYEFMDDLLQFCNYLCHIVISTRESKNYQLKNDILSYIQSHYSDNNLTLELLAERFNVTPSYLTRYFKNQTGKSLMQYLDNIRMEQAKKLLLSTELSLDEIISRCGYVDKNNFIQKFKKYYGYPPISYRNLQQQQMKEA